MATKTLAMPTTISTDEQRIRVTAIKFNKSPEFTCSYQVANGLDWSKAVPLTFTKIFTDGTLSGIETLKDVIFRVFETEATWTSSQIDITGLTIKYCIKDVEEKDKLEWTIGQPKTLTIESRFYSQWLSTSETKMPVIEQYVNTSAVGEFCCLTKDEAIALEGLLNLFAGEVVAELNRKVEYKAEQLKLF